jgi:hypothetical protein
VSDETPIVDGHAAADDHRPGPELRRLADALRAVTDQVVRTAAAPDTLAAAAELVERARELLEPQTPPYEMSVPAFVGTLSDPHEYFPFSPMIGLWSPLAPPIHFEVRAGTVHGRGSLGAAYEGPPGCVHGGIVAGLFDELLGVANITAGLPAMTGTLTIRYRAPTPLFTELQFEGHSEHWERRKVRARGTIHAGGKLCAEAEGIFVMTTMPEFEERARS